MVNSVALIPSEALVSLWINTRNALFTLWAFGQVFFLIAGTLCLVAAIALTIRYQPKRISAAEIGPYNPKFDPLQKKQNLVSSKYRFMAVILFIVGLAPWIFQAMIFTSVIDLRGLTF